MGKSFGAFVAPRYIVFILVVLVSLAWPALAKRKYDAVVMKNGDRITGEIRKLQTGRAVCQTGLRSGTDRPQLVAGGASRESGRLPRGFDQRQTLHRHYSEGPDRAACGRSGD